MINATQIKEHMEVIGSDGGKVDKVIGSEIELAKFDWGSGLRHHLIPVSWVDHVDNKVCLSLTREQAKSAWREKDHHPTPDHPSGPTTII